jgi:hypothetical protein
VAEAPVVENVARQANKTRAKASYDSRKEIID